VSEVSPEITAKLAERERARRDKMYLGTQILGMDFQEDVHTELFSNYISYDSTKPWREQSATKDRLILWPRGFFKSSSLVVEIIQIILNFPDARILIMQGALGVTCNLLSEIKAHFIGTAPNSRLKEVFPDFCADKLGTKFAFTVPARIKKQLQQATVTVASPKSVKTGQHFDILFADDLVNDQNFQSEKKLKKVADEFRAMIPLVDPGGYRFVTGTRYSFGDLYEQIIRANDGQWTISVKDCWLEDGVTPRFNTRELADGRIIGISREQLLQIMRESPSVYASQYLNKPASTGNQLFTEQKLLGAVVSEKDSPALSRAVLFVDLASSTAEYADDSVILCGKIDHLANMYVVDGVGGRWTSSQLSMQLIEMAAKHRPIKVMIEKTASSAYFTDYLKVVCSAKGVSLPLDFLPVNNGKDAKHIRISSLEGYIRTKRIRFFSGLQCQDKLFEQFVQFPRANHDDYIDTVALMAQTFNTFRPGTPMSTSKHPLLAAMEQQEQAQAAAAIFTQAGQRTDSYDDSMGSEFSD
jgi:predicted phage terminase large subunit-like protein